MRYRTPEAYRAALDQRLTRHDEQAATEHLATASAIDPGDFFDFEFRRTGGLDPVAGFRAVRYSDSRWGLQVSTPGARYGRLAGSDRARTGRLAGHYRDGERRTRTADTTIFRGG
jgi:hypothetical protein